jgi:uncharacterized protein (TIRG00374 family)
MYPWALPDEIRMKRWQLWVGIAISVGLTALALRGLRLDQVWSAVQGAAFGWLIPGIAVYFLAVWARAWRWHYLLRPLKQVPTSAAFPIVCIGYMGNNLYPARAGEILRSYVLRRKHGVPMSGSLATILVERSFDGVVMLGFIVFNLPELARATSDAGLVGSIRSVAILGAVVFLAAVLVFGLFARFPQKGAALVGRLPLPSRLQPQVARLTERFLEGLASLRSPRHVLMVLVTSTVIWLLETAKYWIVMQAFPFEVSFFALMLMNGIVNLATTLPSAPGYLGTFDAPGIAVLAAYLVPKPLATAYTLVLHAALWLPITLLGAFYLARESIGWSAVRDELTQEAGL